MSVIERLSHEIYTENTGLLYQYIFRRTGNKADAEDILHEVFIVMLFKMNQFLGEYPDNAGQVRAYLFGIANKQLLHYWRDHRDIWNTEISMELLPDLTDPQSDFSGSELSFPDWVTPQDRKLLLLKCEGYSLKDIAGQLGISYPACRMRISRLTRDLKKFWGK